MASWGRDAGFWGMEWKMGKRWTGWTGEKLETGENGMNLCGFLWMGRVLLSMQSILSIWRRFFVFLE